MPVAPTTEVQRKFINETVRPMIDEVVRFKHRMQSYILDHDNQQSPIAGAANDPIGDGADGQSPRSDAPTITVGQLGQLRAFIGNMNDQISDPALAALVSLLVRDLDTVLRG